MSENQLATIESYGTKGTLCGKCLDNYAPGLAELIGNIQTVRADDTEESAMQIKVNKLVANLVILGDKNPVGTEELLDTFIKMTEEHMKK